MFLLMFLLLLPNWSIKAGALFRVFRLFLPDTFSDFLIQQDEVGAYLPKVGKVRYLKVGS